MAKIFVDTNIFLDLYQAALDRLGVFDELSNYKKYLLVTDQVLNEFQRNRATRLSMLSKEFEKSVSLRPFTTAILKEAKPHRELLGIRDAYRKKAEEVVEYLRSLLEDVEKDPVASKFFAMVGDPEVLRLPIDDRVIDRAYKRKLLGNPPTSHDKFTIGDEVTWEAILLNLHDDLVIVSRDHTFVENVPLLSSEFQARTGCSLLLVTDKISEALKQLGQVPTGKLIAEEERLQEDLEMCPICGRKGQILGYEGSDGDESAWFECYYCGHIQPL